MRNIVINSAFSDVDHKTNYSVITGHVDDDYYAVDFQPEDFVLSGNAAQPSTAATLLSLPIGNERVAVVQFANGNTDEIKLSLRPRKYWTKGNIEVTLWYTGDTSSTNPIRWSIAGFKHAIGEDITSAATFSSDETTAGPSTAFFLKKYTFTTYLSMAQEHEFLHFRIFRASGHASDTYAGDAYIALIKTRLIPALVQDGVKGD